MTDQSELQEPYWLPLEDASEYYKISRSSS